MGKRRGNGCGTLFLRNGWFYFKIMRNGKIICKSTKTQDRATAEKLMNEFSAGHDLPPKARLAALAEILKPDSANPKVEDAFTLYINSPKNATQSSSAQSTDRGRWQYFTRWLHGYHKERSRLNQNASHPEIKKLGEITSAIAAEFFKYAVKNTSPNTLNKYIRIYKRMWNFIGMEKNPWEDFQKLKETPNRRRELNKKEVQKLIDEADGELKILFTFGPYTGQRMTDCAKMKWEYFSKDLSTINYIPRKTVNSSGVNVALPVHPVLLKAIKSCPTRKLEYITPGLASMTEDQLSDIVMAHFRKCGLEEFCKQKNYRRRTAIVGFHSFRSTFIGSMAEAGAPLIVVQSLVGHVSPDMTQMYYRSDVERARKYIDKI